MTCWKHLGVAPGSDLRTIKSAYAKALKHIDREQDPDTFMALYQAYQDAKRLASMSNDSGLATEQTPVASDDWVEVARHSESDDSTRPPFSQASEASSIPIPWQLDPGSIEASDDNPLIDHMTALLDDDQARESVQQWYALASEPAVFDANLHYQAASWLITRLFETRKRFLPPAVWICFNELFEFRGREEAFKHLPNPVHARFFNRLDEAIKKQRKRQPAFNKARLVRSRNYLSLVNASNVEDYAAETGARFLSALADLVISFQLWKLCWYALYWNNGPAQVGLWVWSMLAVLFVWTSLWQLLPGAATPAQWLFGVRACTLDGRRLPWGRMLLRNAVYVVSYWGVIITYMYNSSKAPRYAHDRLSNSIQVNSWALRKDLRLQHQSDRLSP